jgi:hypothetical protein
MGRARNYGNGKRAVPSMIQSSHVPLPKKPTVGGKSAETRLFKGHMQPVPLLAQLKTNPALSGVNEPVALVYDPTPNLLPAGAVTYMVQMREPGPPRK